MKSLCYIVSINSSLAGMFERLADIGAHWVSTNVVCGKMETDKMEITIYVREHKACDVEEILAWYV